MRPGNIALYADNGYLNTGELLKLPFTFIWVIGGRGTGKTYGFLRDIIQSGQEFMLLRRTATQVQLLQTPEFSPFGKLNSDFGWDLVPKSISKEITGIYHAEEAGAPIGFMAPLSTFANTRGFNADTLDIILFDEFIKEKQERYMKGEAFAFLNAYETMNRNRELEGRPPIRAVFCSNSVELDNPLFIELGFVTLFERMKREGREIQFAPKFDSVFINLEHSPISEAKRTTALYRLARQSTFAEMSLDNSFAIDYNAYQSLPLGEYKPLVKVGEITLYKHKSNGSYYCTPHTSGSPDTYGTSDAELRRFRRTWGMQISTAYLARRITFETYYTEALLTRFMG